MDCVFSPEWEELLQPRMPYIERCLRMVDGLRHKGIEIYPPQDKIFHALDFVPPAGVKVCIIGQDPYHEPGQAQGLAFSVAPGTKIPPSLRNIHKELVADIGCPAPTTGDLTPWAKQGVLLLNTILTVEKGKANSHARRLGWQVVTTQIVHSLLHMEQPPVFIIWGRSAKLFMDEVVRLDEHNEEGTPEVIKVCSSHPCPMSAARRLRAGNKSIRPFFGSHPFSKTNKILEKQGRPTINWELP